MNNISNQKNPFNQNSIGPFQLKIRHFQVKKEALKTRPAINQEWLKMNAQAQICDHIYSDMRLDEKKELQTKRTWVGFFICYLRSQSRPFLVKLHQFFESHFDNYKKVNEELKEFDDRRRKNQSLLSSESDILDSKILYFNGLKSTCRHLFEPPSQKEGLTETANIDVNHFV